MGSKNEDPDEMLHKVVSHQSAVFAPKKTISRTELYNFFRNLDLCPLKVTISMPIVS